MTEQQLAFDMHPIVPATGTTLQERFASFHGSNPWVYVALETMASDLAGKGRRIGVKMLAEVVRWNYTRQTTDPASSFRLNNSYVSRYSRLLLEAHPEWADLIEVRELLSERVPS